MFACLHAPGNLPLLLECARYFSPLIEETSNDTVTLDARGLRLIFGAPDQVAAAIERRIGIAANIVIASNPETANHAARGIAGVTVIAPGREAAALAPLPVYLLGGSPEFAHTLDTWGIRTFGEFAALPPLGVAARLGEEGTILQQSARGEGGRLLRLRSDPVRFEQEVEFEESIDLLEPLLLAVSGMLNDQCERLRAHGLAANEIRLLFKLERAADHPMAIRLPVPMLQPVVFLKLLQLKLSGAPPQAPVEKIRLELIPAKPRSVQHGLFLASSPEPEKLEITLARIRNLVGDSHAGAAQLLDTHRPDSFHMAALAAAKEHPGAARPRMVLRRLRPPRPARVWCAAGGEPLRISSAVLEGRVSACAGPWTTSGDWWGEEWDRQEWDVQVSSGGIFRIHQDRRASGWFVEGNYD